MDTQQFVEELFGEVEGYVYSPIKDRGLFRQFFFQWPRKKDELLQHIEKNAEDCEVYIGPMLYTMPKVHPSTFLGTRFVWAEFDGNSGEDKEFTIEPSIKIQSSNDGHEHWYWKLDEFISDATKLTDVTKRVSYGLDADRSGWDYATVLRPPGTKNHRKNKPVKVLSTNDKIYKFREFEQLPKIPDNFDILIDDTKLPSYSRTVEKYTWTVNGKDLISQDKVVKVGNRSSALANLALECVDMGMSNEETFVILTEVDKRWKKFYPREDAPKRIIALISYARSKKLTDLDMTDVIIPLRYKDFINTDVKLEWVIPGLVPVAGSSLLFGPPGVGKSTLALRMAIAIATGKKQFLNWPVVRKQNVMFVSLEMPHEEVKHFLSDMNLSEEDEQQLQEHFFIWAIGHMYAFDNKDNQIELLKYIDRFDIELLIIDSLGVCTQGSVNNQDHMKPLFSFLNKYVRKERRCGYMFVHHPRKPGVGDVRKPQDHNDAYGDAYIINNAQTVMNLNPLNPPLLKLNIFKSRLAMDQSSFQLKRLPNRDFETVHSTLAKKQDKINKEEDELLEQSPGIFKLGKNIAGT